MRQIDFTEITFLQMQVFITAGRELNFTRTANQCHITQPTVSRLIDSLEKTTGLQLFIRKRSGLQLTPAGKALHISFSQTIEKMERDFQNAFEIQEGYHNFLNICITDGINPHDIYEIIKRMRKDDEIMILNHFAPSNYFESCVEIPLEGSRSGLLLVTRTADMDNKLINRFKNYAKEHAKLQDYTLDV